MEGWRLGSLDVWRLGGAPEVGGRAVAFGDDETERRAALTKNTKDHKGHKARPEWEPQI